ncbi:DUF2637 domain-containing protein [Actinocatenispora rupis]|uniref:DUF2637 domain-containing protein n=1 Tax=Actinocatenispora rupis TaxID=519421 RepID=A0A8J3NCH8_9ACTN|nr:DUF2637 domain-containing protein [Actinocatenispora rupis]GID14061.1 hypothetical protein Aru02nite_49500 [Actinocatenispora rupis]
MSAAQRAESTARLVIMAAIGLMAGAASFTHMHDWTMQKAPAGTPEWFGWANAVVSELTPALALLEWRRRRRTGGSVGYPVALLIGSGLLSLAAQVSQANDSMASKGLAALPAIAFTLLIKLVFSGLPTPGRTESATAADHIRGDGDSRQDQRDHQAMNDRTSNGTALNHSLNGAHDARADATNTAPEQRIPAGLHAPLPTPSQPNPDRHGQTVPTPAAEHIGDSARNRPAVARVVAPSRPTARVNGSASEVPA